MCFMSFTCENLCGPHFSWCETRKSTCVILECFLVKTHVIPKFLHVFTCVSHTKYMIHNVVHVWKHVNHMGFYHKTFQNHMYSCALTCFTLFTCKNLCEPRVYFMWYVMFTCDLHKCYQLVNFTHYRYTKNILIPSKIFKSNHRKKYYYWSF